MLQGLIDLVCSGASQMYRVASYIHHGFSGTCFADHWSALCAGVILDSSVSLSTLSVLLYGAVDLGLV